MIQGLDRELTDSFGQLTRRHQQKQTRFRCIIKRVNYVRHKVEVTGKNYSGPSHVKVSANILMGTVDRPLVFPDDICFIERQADHHWLCVSIRNKTHCATSTDGEDVEIGSDADTLSSYSSQGDYGITLTPLDLQIPPIEPLGQLTLPDLRLPSTVITYDVGGGYPGSFSGSFQQNIGLPNGATWTKYFVTVTGSPTWDISLNGSSIASGTGSSAGVVALGSPESFVGGSTFVFSFSGSGSDLFFGVGV